ncbi:MAG: low temperature requirement protein A [Planctomycetota bacterium]
MNEARLAAPRRPFVRRVAARSRDEHHRPATPLELFFDLVIVVAVARAASGLHHAIAEDHVGQGVLAYVMVFFGIWWAWMNFTWFASAYDNDDVLYRLLVLVQLVGALIFAAGVPDMAAGDRFVGTMGYVVMRLALVVNWMRAARGDPEHRRAAVRYATGVLGVQFLWVASLWLPPAGVVPGFFALLVVELLVPAWAEGKAFTPWHPGHIAERYGLFTIIALGESILAASIAFEQADDETSLSKLLPVAIGGVLLVFSAWWLYFERSAAPSLHSAKRAFLWGYGHYFVFASVAAIGAGLASSIDLVQGRAQADATVVGASVAVPVAIYLTTLWSLDGCGDRTLFGRLIGATGVVLVLLSPLTPIPVLSVGVVTALLVVAESLRPRHAA